VPEIVDNPNILAVTGTTIRSMSLSRNWLGNAMDLVSTKLVAPSVCINYSRPLWIRSISQTEQPGIDRGVR
jgi:hypothetical protein